jgi:hypothetical protein
LPVVVFLIALFAQQLKAIEIEGQQKLAVEKFSGGLLIPSPICSVASPQAHLSSKRIFFRSTTAPFQYGIPTTGCFEIGIPQGKMFEGFLNRVPEG